MSEPYVKYACVPERFKPVAEPRVRWLSFESDFELWEVYVRAKGFPMDRTGWLECREQRYTYCGFLEGGRLLAAAAVWKRDPDEWELAGVGTLIEHRKKGLGKAVSSFITAYILANGKRPTCNTAEDNAAMRRTAESLGYERAG